MTSISSSKCKIYIIGDVHGCIKTLKALINKLPKDSKIIFTGDLIDRGPSSKDVISFVRQNKYDCVMGNHEEMLLENIDILKNNPQKLDTNSWYNVFGGYETLKNYTTFLASFFKSTQLEKDIKWIESLPPYIEYKNITDKEGRHLVVSHSSVGKLWKDRHCDYNSQDFIHFEKQAMWSRDKQIYDNKDIFNIFAHTPTNKPIKTYYYANIDTGCVYNNGDELGKLSAIEFPSLDIISQEFIENSNE